MALGIVLIGWAELSPGPLKSVPGEGAGCHAFFCLTLAFPGFRPFPVRRIRNYKEGKGLSC